MRAVERYDLISAKLLSGIGLIDPRESRTHHVWQTHARVNSCRFRDQRCQLPPGDDKWVTKQARQRMRQHHPRRRQRSTYPSPGRLYERPVREGNLENK